MRRLILKSAARIAKLFFSGFSNKNAYVFIEKTKKEEYPDFIERTEFFFESNYRLREYSSKTEFYLKLIFSGKVKIIFTPSNVNPVIIENFFINVDYHTNPFDGWEWHRALNLCNPVSEEMLDKSEARFKQFISKLPALDRAFIFGTGPSLSNANKLVEEPGYKIVCNTIVKDKDLWIKLKPHFIVAGDAIYHFSNNAYATAFRADLRKCLLEHPCIFLYPAQFHPFIYKELPEFRHLLVPVPVGTHTEIAHSLLEEFSLPALGNVLNLLLLPLAITLAKNIYLLGFDGRAPGDKLFWSNSGRHSYPDLIASIQKNHPQFFAYYIDDKNPNKYVNAVHGDQLDENLTSLEKTGYEITLITPSYTKSLQNRYKNIFHL